MTQPDLMDPALAPTAEALRARAEPFAVATVVRTAGFTAAKPGAKALLAADGTVLQGWLGGGCTRAAVARAVRRAVAEGAPQLVSVAPEEALAEKGLAPGAAVDGVAYARNGCPSKGTVDIFVEPVLPAPELALYGASPVAGALADLAPRFGWAVTPLAAEDAPAPPPQTPAAPGRLRCIVIATQGQGDLAALKSALSAPADHVAFVGSRLKYAALADKLRAAGLAEDAVASVHAPAGLAIHAVTPEEIALSILAGLTMTRRAPRGEGGAA